MKKIKRIAFIPFVLIMLSLMLYLLLVLVYCLPTESMHVRMVESSTIFEEEGTYPRLKKYLNSQLDNWTDAIILLTASYSEVDNVWEAAIAAERYTVSKGIIDSDAPSDALVYLYQEDGKNVQSCEYARYWHGYLVFLKPLLVFFNYGQIRGIIKGIQYGLIAVLLVLLCKRNIGLVLPLITSLLFLNVGATSSSLQFNSVLIVTLAAMILILLLKNKLKEDLYYCGLFFMLIGAVTSFVDLLTYPLVTLGMPLVLWVTENYSEKLVDNIKRIIYISIFWGIGYGGNWALKWILGAVITGKNIIGDAADKIAERTGAEAFSDPIGYFDVIIRQFGSSIQLSWAFIVLGLCIAWLLYVIRKKCINWKLIITLGFIACYPFVWYFVLKNHSYIHCWFTYRELAISLFAMLSYIMMEFKICMDTDDPIGFLKHYRN